MKKRLLFSLVALVLLFAPTVLAQVGSTYYVKARSARVRAEPKTNAPIVATLRRGDAVVVLEAVDGARVSGSTVWYKVEVSDKEGYIHSSLVTDKQPSTQVAPPSTQATPQPGLVSTPPPSSPSTFSCSCQKTCSQMASCEEAYYQLNQCGCSARDTDKDGVPCESICPGG